MNNVLQGWIETVIAKDIDQEDAVRFDYGDRTFAIYRTAKDQYYATDGWCTHERFHLAGGLVMGNIIECPKHNGQLDYTTGQAKRAPICANIRTYPVKIESGKIFVKID
ncbi:MocE family 2Fe-2S type ferredoxin [Cohnella yongneupensis]|uniref:MocE family 2Fe-2S type ferredoxin n=1 Tax=Cohnella yongneupensis TaxID=425006 RepID=A0ABW0QWU5_9BACL